MANLHKIFYQQLTQELSVARTLHRLLCEERDMLDPPQLEPLSKLQEEKQQQLDLLQKLSSTRIEWLKEQGIPLNKTCYQSHLLKSTDEDENNQLAIVWQELADQFEENRKLTDILSIIVLTARKRAQSLMKILRGQKNSPNLYTKSGQTQSNSSGSSSSGLGYAKA